MEKSRPKQLSQRLSGFARLSNKKHGILGIVYMGKIGLTLFILSWCSTYLMAQIPVPNLINYSKTEYNGGRQNWDIEINDAGVIYFSNTSGLLYNIYGEWGLLEIPENKIIRAALTESDTVWVGGAEIGYFVKKEGTYSYKKELDTSIAQIWNIEAVNECIFFQSEYDIFIYDKRNKTYTNKKLDARIWSILQWNEKIWVVLINGQIGTINKEGFIEVTQSRFLEVSITRSICH